MNERQLRRRCRDLLRRLKLRRPVDPFELCRRYSQDRGRPLIVATRQLPFPGGFGGLFPMPSKDLILCPDNISAEYQAQIIFHEVMHLDLDHLAASREAQQPLMCGQLMTDSSGARTRSLYADQREWEAETAATILSEWSGSSAKRAGTAIGRTEEAVLRAIGGRGV
ncbi:hypothetical protein [Pseudonocardia alni]|uniref:hypothetical protein n=1 Tax=Pseudonocardia alni TaxID=33907 RepID=UPI0033DF18C6